jgi:COP9 signalosome complex subunit 8
MRLPDVLKVHPVAQALYRLAASTTQRKYGHVYPRAQELHDVLRNSQVPGVDLQAAVDVFLTRFLGMHRSVIPSVFHLLMHYHADTFRLRTLRILAKAYSSIPLALAQSYLECTSEQVLTGTWIGTLSIMLRRYLSLVAATQHKWRYDAATEILMPVPPSKSGLLSGNVTDAMLCSNHSPQASHRPVKSRDVRRGSEHTSGVMSCSIFICSCCCTVCSPARFRISRS